MSGIKVFIGGILYDSEKEPVILVFENDIDRRVTSSHLVNMAQKDGVRFYAAFPSNTVTPEIFDKMCQAVENSLRCPKHTPQVEEDEDPDTIIKGGKP